jgi:hypothetical protein
MKISIVDTGSKIIIGAGMPNKPDKTLIKGLLKGYSRINC